MKALWQPIRTVKENLKFVSAYAILFATYIIILPKDGHWGDMYCWIGWCNYIFTNGLGKVYQSGTDYLPLYHYILYLFGLIQGSTENIERNIYLLKIFTIIAEFIGGFFLIKLIKEKISNTYELFFYSMFFFLNIAVFYNSIIWGQVDGILTTLLFVSVYFALKERVLYSLLFFLLAINMKLQAIIFMPIIGLMLLPLMVKQFSLKNLSVWFGSLIILQILILLPFIIKDDIGRVLLVIINSFGKYPVVSMNAYNFWFWFLKGNLMQIPDSNLFLGYSYKSWGLLLFFTSSFLALWPLLKMVYCKLIRKAIESLSTEKIMLTSALVPLLFFFFNTQMHERYSHPALMFVITYSILSKDFCHRLLSA
jgi:Gpi18-like mannosyltransferase